MRSGQMKADDIVAKLLVKIAEINKRKDYLNYVERVAVFGSYLTDTEDLGDIDIVVELARKLPDEEYIKASITRSYENGPENSNWLDHISYGETEVLQAIKNISRHISLSNYRMISGLEYAGDPFEILFNRQNDNPT